MGFPGGASGKEPTHLSKQVDIRDAGSIPGLGRSLEKGMATHSTILTWRTLWTEEPGGLWCIELQRVGHYEAT